MPKNVSITLDGKTKTISGATKIQTCLEDGGNCLWIPKDDVPLTTLSVTEDGTYYPQENFYGFSKVTAEGIGTTQMGELIEKTVDKNGTYNIGDESGSPYGYSKFTVNVDLSEDSGGGGGESKTPVVGKDADGNDEMVDTDDDGNIVMTALPTEIKVIIPPTKLEYNRYEAIDYSGISVYAYISKMVHWLGTTTVQLEEGSTLNPISIAGETVTASVGDGVLYVPDRTGKNDIQLVWDGAKWVKEENYSAETALWTSEDYPTGKIPFEELIFPIQRANEVEDAEVVIKSHKESDLTYPPYNITPTSSIFVSMPIYVVFRITERIGKGSGWLPYGPGYITRVVYKDISGNAAGTIYSDKSDVVFASYGIHEYGDNARNLGLIIASPTSFTKKNLHFTCDNVFSTPYYTYEYPEYYENEAKGANMTLIYAAHIGYSSASHADDISVFTADMLGGSWTHNGKTVNYVMQEKDYLARITNRTISQVDPPEYIAKLRSCLDSVSVTPSSYEVEREKIAYFAWTMIYGDDVIDSKTIILNIPVQWKRPGDGKILETTFTAWMNDEESNDGGQQPQPAPTPAPG